ncbi:histone Octamer, chromosomal Protein, alpha carbons only [Mycena amicta]|nr:histone Octamer, chromosomal Protein, alpha carbons only [Mycena amicta]
MVYVGTKSTFKRLARRGGVQRMAGGVYVESHGVLYPHLKELVRMTVLYANHSYRRTVKQEDVRRALRMQGARLYT